jgi:hypothetical protein
MDEDELPNEAYRVSKIMITQGGSFVRHLGMALSHADLDNVKRIKKAFPDYWEMYLKIADKEL